MIFTTTWIIIFVIIGFLLLLGIFLIGGIVGYGVTSRPGCIPLFNVVTGKIDYISVKTLKDTGIAGFYEVRVAGFFGILKKPDLIPTPKLIKIQGKPIFALAIYINKKI
jgi:hypothetical protein